MFNSWGTENTTNLINVPNPRPDTHEWYPDWVDPFDGDCYELTSAAVKYDSETMPKLDLIDRMCGFKIQFDNYSERSALDVRVMRDGATTLASSALVAVLAAQALFN